MMKFYYTLEFIVYYLTILVKANIYIAYDILSPKMLIDPCLIKVPINIKSDIGILLFSNLLSMTPGTLSIDLTPDKKLMWVHVLYKKSEDEMQAEIEKIQGKIKRITR